MLLQIFIDKSNYMRHEIQGGTKYYKNYRRQSLRALTFRPQFRNHADKTLAEVAEKARQILGLKKKDEITFVAVHNRRTDYLEFRKKRLKLDPLREDYFLDVFEYYREEYDHPVFIYTSDDMAWKVIIFK